MKLKILQYFYYTRKRYFFSIKQSIQQYFYYIN